MGFTLTRPNESLRTVNAVVERVLEEADKWGIQHIVYNTHGYCEEMVKFMEKKGFKVYDRQGILTVRSLGNSKFLED